MSRLNIECVRKKEAANSIGFDYKIKDPDKKNYISLLGAKEIDFIEITGEVCQKNGLAAIEYAIEAKFTAECARCGKEKWQVIQVSGEKYIADKSEEEEKDGSVDFYIAETDGIIDLSEFIVEFLGVEVPYRYLCSEDCKGLCQKCGKDLNEGECYCPKKEKNPAFNILDDFFKDE